MRYRFLRYPGGLAKAVTLSYDDGCKQDIRFSDVISEAGLKCTFNLNGKKLREFVLSDEIIQEKFLNRGHEIAVHGAMHRAPGVLRPVEGIKDVLDCRIELENRLGIIIRGMAYPDSGIRLFSNDAEYEKIKQYLTDLDIAYARSLGTDNDDFDIPTDWHKWMPTGHHDNYRLNELMDEFLKLDPNGDSAYSTLRRPRLFYIWGHTYEFDNNNNWERVDEICEKLGGHDDIWYATNIEIYDYVQAYYSLVYSADGNIIYNPTLYEIWFNVDGEKYKINPGETLKLK